MLLQTHLQGQALAGGLTSGMWGCVIPSASPRATTRRPGGQSIASSAGGCVEGCPPGRRAVGRCQADGMTHELQRGLAEQTRSERPTSARHVPARIGRNVQARPHEAIQDGTGRAEVSTFGTKRSQVQILSPRPQKQQVWEVGTQLVANLPGVLSD